jgi:hypothetical protein
MVIYLIVHLATKASLPPLYLGSHNGLGFILFSSQESKLLRHVVLTQLKRVITNFHNCHTRWKTPQVMLLLSWSKAPRVTNTTNSLNAKQVLLELKNRLVSYLA